MGGSSFSPSMLRRRRSAICSARFWRASGLLTASIHLPISSRLETLKFSIHLMTVFWPFRILANSGGSSGTRSSRSGGDGEVGYPADAGSSGLLHLLVDQDEVAAGSWVAGAGSAGLRPAEAGLREERGAEELAADLDGDTQAVHLLPRAGGFEGQPRDDPAESAAERLERRAETLCRTSFGSWRHAVPSRKIYTGCISIKSNPRIFLSAGEASGDQYGAELITELRGRMEGAEFFGLGGTKMEAAGLARMVRAEDVAHMGITEVLLHMPRVYGEYRRLVGAIKKQRPDVAVLIDFPDVNFRLAKELKKLGVPVVYFVSPQLWAWKRRRLRWVQERVDRMMVIFPFEETFYKARGVKAEFVGHPLAVAGGAVSSRVDYAAANMFANPEHPGTSTHIGRQWIALLPGSREKEIAANLPAMLEAAAILGPGYDFLIPVANTVDKSGVSELIFQKLIPRLQWPQSSITLVSDAREALFHARASVVASGTATVLAAVAGNPFVVVYRVSNMTYRVAKRLVAYPAEIPAQVDAAGNLRGGDGKSDCRAAGGSGAAAGAVYGRKCGGGAAGRCWQTGRSGSVWCPTWRRCGRSCCWRATRGRFRGWRAPFRDYWNAGPERQLQEPHGGTNCGFTGGAR